MGRLAAREENQRRVEFDYDTEERLIAIRNEHGSVYRFECRAEYERAGIETLSAGP